MNTEKASFNVLLATIALAIIAFLPPAAVPFMVVKTVIIAGGTLIAIILYIVSRIQEKKAEFPMHPLVIIGGLLGLSVIVSTILSASPADSFLNANFDQYSGAFLLVVLAAALLTTLLARTRERIISVTATVIGSFSFVALFQIVRLIAGGRILALGTFTTLTSTMAGSWYDLAILAGIVFLISFFSLESFYSGSLPATKRLKIIAIILCAVSFIFLVLIDLTLIWIGIAVATLLFALHRFFFNSVNKKSSADGEKKSAKFSKFANVPYFAVIVFVIAALFAWKGAVISNPLIQKLNISYAEVSLPWQSTLGIAEPTLRHSALSGMFGAGPDRFPEQYLLYKPEGINHTQFWNITFPSGSSFILTSLVDQGIFGGMLWLILTVWFIVIGIKAMLRPPETALARSIVTISFLTTLFLWCMLLLYTPSHAVIFVTLVMTGLFVAILGVEYGRSERANVPKVKMLALHGVAWKKGESEKVRKERSVFILLWIILLFAVAGLFVYIKDAIAQTYFQAGVNASVAGNVTSAQASFEKALAFNKNDTYYQALAQVDAYQINSIISTASAASSSAVSAIGSLINQGIGFARSGQAIDPANADNFLAEGDIAVIAAALNVPNGYADARAAYFRAASLSPMNPAIYLSAARLEYASGSTTVAEADINDALELKPDYTDALFEAGVISYNIRDYQTAAKAFETVLQDDGTYVNAEYFLGLTFARAGDTADAITVFTALAKAYPTNTTISQILSDLQSGQSIFTAAQAQAVTQNSPNPSKALSSKVSKTAKITPKTDTTDTTDAAAASSGASSDASSSSQ